MLGAALHGLFSPFPAVSELKAEATLIHSPDARILTATTSIGRWWEDGGCAWICADYFLHE